MEIQLEDILPQNNSSAQNSNHIDTSLSTQTHDVKQTHKTTIDDLSPDEVFYILQFVDRKGILAMSATNKKYYVISSKRMRRC